MLTEFTFLSILLQFLRKIGLLQWLIGSQAGRADNCLNIHSSIRRLDLRSKLVTARIACYAFANSHSFKLMFAAKFSLFRPYSRFAFFKPIFLATC